MPRTSAPLIAPREGILDEVKAAIGDAFIEAKHAAFEDSVTVRRESIVEVCTTLRDRFDSEARRRGARSTHDGQVLFGLRASF